MSLKRPMTPYDLEPKGLPFACENCGTKPTADDVVRLNAICDVCGDEVVAYTVDAAELVIRLRDALEWCLGKEPSPCRCMEFSNPPHVCMAHQALAGKEKVHQSIPSTGFVPYNNPTRLEVEQLVQRYHDYAQTHLPSDSNGWLVSMIVIFLQQQIALATRRVGSESISKAHTGMLGKNTDECLSILEKMECTLCEEYRKANPGPCYLNCESGSDCNAGTVKKELKRLRNALELYGKHEDECPAWGWHDIDTMPKCTCGLTAALAGKEGVCVDIKEAKPAAFQVELVWNREFDFVPYGGQYADLDSAIKQARELEDMGDGARVKKARVIDNEGNIVYAYGRKITPRKKEKDDASV